MDANGMMTGAHLLSRPAEEYENDAAVEAMWALKACQYAEVHFKIISSCNPALLKLTKHDDRIYNTFQTHFPDLNIEMVTEESLKSDSAKEKWRIFCEELKDIEDYNFGTLLRLNCREDYSEQNTILVTRIQYLGIEISRNRKGLNDHIWTSHSVA